MTMNAINPPPASDVQAACKVCGVPDGLEALRTIMLQGFAEMRGALSHSATDRQELHAEVNGLRTQLAVLRDTPSSADLKTEAALADEVVTRRALDVKVDKLLAVATRFEAGWDKAMANPKAKLILAALAYAAWQYLSAKGLHLPALPGLS